MFPVQNERLSEHRFGRGGGERGGEEGRGGEAGTDERAACFLVFTCFHGAYARTSALQSPVSQLKCDSSRGFLEKCQDEPL